MTLTIERLKWLHDAATELSATKLKMTMRPDELLVLTSELLANREAQPVIVVGDDGGDALAYRRLIQSFAPGTKLYTAPPAPAESMPVAWSGWACQYPGHMPRLYGEKAIAEVNCDYDGGMRLLFLSSAPPAPANANAVAWEMRYWNSGYNCWHDWERITAEQHAEMSAEHATSNDYEFRVLYDAPPVPAVVNGRTAEGWMAEALLQKKVAEDLRKSATAVPEEMTIEQSYENVQTWHYANGWNACRAAMLAQPVSSGYKLPDNVREALTLALQAMEFMGDTLNNIDAVCTEDVEFVTPAFTAVRGLLAAASEGGN